MRCPVCKAVNVEPPQCRRCKADLSLLGELEAQRSWMLHAARQALVQGRWHQAVRLVRHADWLRSDAQSQQLRAIAHLLVGDFPRAWHFYHQGPPGAAGAG